MPVPESQKASDRIASAGRSGAAFRATDRETPVQAALSLLAGAGAEGLTDDQLIVRGIHFKAVARVRGDLQEAGVVVAQRYTEDGVLWQAVGRTTRTGSLANVWVLAEHGAAPQGAMLSPLIGRRNTRTEVKVLREENARLQRVVQRLEERLRIGEQGRL